MIFSASGCRSGRSTRGLVATPVRCISNSCSRSCERNGSCPVDIS
ncbi:MAG: hypothetical protein R3A48_13875 [Polyangiales bacterium]